jgi:hypothetical protein
MISAFPGHWPGKGEYSIKTGIERRKVAPELAPFEVADMNEIRALSAALG